MCLLGQCDNDKRNQKQAGRQKYTSTDTDITTQADHSIRPCLYLHCTRRTHFIVIITSVRFRILYCNLNGNASYLRIQCLPRECQCQPMRGDRWRTHTGIHTFAHEITHKSNSRLKRSLRRKLKIRRIRIFFLFVRFLCICFKSHVISSKWVGIFEDASPASAIAI